MNHNQLQLLKREIDTYKKELIDISVRTSSLSHHLVIEKSHELDALIFQYHELMDQAK